MSRIIREVGLWLSEKASAMEGKDVLLAAAGIVGAFVGAIVGGLVTSWTAPVFIDHYESPRKVCAGVPFRWQVAGDGTTAEGTTSSLMRYTRVLLPRGQKAWTQELCATTALHEGFPYYKIGCLTRSKGLQWTNEAIPSVGDWTRKALAAMSPPGNCGWEEETLEPEQKPSDEFRAKEKDLREKLIAQFEAKCKPKASSVACPKD
jgi:hypothetical protein